jgi:hypothetical protein
MTLATLPSQDLVRKAVIEVAQLPENELLVVIEIVGDLKKQRAQKKRSAAADLVARARQRAAETSRLSRAEMMERFSRTLETIRAEAIAKGTAIEGERESD